MSMDLTNESDEWKLSHTLIISRVGLEYATNT